MKKLVFLLQLILLSVIGRAQSGTQYVPVNPESIKLSFNVNNQVRWSYISDLVRLRVSLSKHSTDSSAMMALINARLTTTTGDARYRPISYVPTWTEVTSKPSTFAPSAHLHPINDLTQSGATIGQVPQWNGTNWVPATVTSGGSSYTLPTASGSVLGGVKVGTGLAIDGAGVLSATGSGGLASTNFIVGETPSGTINGSNVTFTLANTPVTNKEILYLNGIRQKRASDYTISGATITFITAPFTGDELLSDYLK